MLRFWRSTFAGIQENRQLLWSGLTQLVSAAALVDLKFGSGFKAMGFGPPWFDQIVSFATFTLVMYGLVMCSIVLVHAFTSIVILRLSQEETLRSFKFVATTGFILLLLCTFVHQHNRHQSAEPAYDAYQNLD